MKVDSIQIKNNKNTNKKKPRTSYNPVLSHILWKLSPITWSSYYLVWFLFLQFFVLVQMYMGTHEHTCRSQHFIKLRSCFNYITVLLEQTYFHFFLCQQLCSKFSRNFLRLPYLPAFVALCISPLHWNGSVCGFMWNNRLEREGRSLVLVLWSLPQVRP